METVVAAVTEQGDATIWNEKLLPYDLYLEEDDDFDTRINNRANF